jgi:hypothetical protein
MRLREQNSGKAPRNGLRPAGHAIRRRDRQVAYAVDAGQRLSNTIRPKATPMDKAVSNMISGGALAGSPSAQGA